MFGFGSQNTSSFGTFGQANKPATSTFSGTGTGLFGATPNTGGFGTTPQSGSVFGQPQQQQTAPTNIFGGFNQAKAPTTSLFGAPQNTTTMFGQNRLGTGTTTGGGLFGGTSTIAAVSPFSQTAPQGAGGTSVPFNPITGQDTMMRNSIATPISTRNQCITTMKEYETKSLEELRMEDYQLGRKGPSNQAAGVFGATSNPTTASMFSMGQPAGAATNFGQTSSFGSTAPTGGGLFSSPLNQNKPQNSFFNTTTSTGPFGANSFNFGNTATSSTGSSLFNTTTTSNTGLGSFGSAFSQPAQPQQQQQQPLSLFSSGVKPLTAPATSTPFSFTGNTALNKPAGGFGTTTNAFGTPAAQPFGTSLFGSAANQQQAKPLFPSFSTAATSQSLFGTSNTFSFSTPASAPAFSSASLGASTGAFPSLNTTTSFGQPISTTGFGNTSFTGFANLGSGGQSLFSNANPTMNANIANPNASAGGPVPFGTTPYKDSPLFYNLVNNRSLEEMTKPTNPVAQRQIKEASRRKASTSIGTSATVKNLTFPTPKLHTSMKDTLFDGFEEEDQGSTIDILSPKTSVKKLNLKNISFTRYQPNSSLFNGSGKDDRNHSLDLSARLNSSNNDSLLVSNTSVSEIFPSRSVGDNVVVHDSSSSDSPAVSFYEPINKHGHQEKSYVEVLPGESADKTQEDEGNEEHVCGVKCTRVGYYMLPSVKDLDLMTDSQGNCFVRNFVIGRRNYGEIRFLDVVNVGNIDVDDIVLFRHKEVVVYPDDTNKPPVGEGINVPAEITLERVWPIDKVTKDPIKVPAKIKALKYEEKLRRSCARLDAEFISYNEHRGEWVFRVKHFSKYSCAPEEDEDDAVMEMEVPKGGLGGKTIEQLKNATGSTQAIIVNERGDNVQNFRDSPEHMQEVPSMLEEEKADGRGDARFADEVSGVVPRDDILVPSNAMDIFGEEESPADYPDYFGLSESLKTAPSEMHKRYLTAVSAAKIVHHRRRDEEPSLEPERKLTNFRELVPYPSSNFRRGIPVRFGPRNTFMFTAKGTKEYRKLNRFIGLVHIKQLLSHVEVHNRGPKLKNLYSKKVKDELTLVLNNSKPDDKFCLKPEGIIGELVELSNCSLQTFCMEQKSTTSKHQLATVCQDELQLWKLCEILWPPQELTNAELLDEGHQIQQRVKLSEWLKENTAAFFGTEYDEKDVSVIGLLKKGRHSEACDLAISQGNFNLALNLTQCCGTGPKSMLEEQIIAWTEQNVLEFIPEEILRVYRLCAGIPIWDDIDLSKMNTSQWLQHFAVYLWYMCPMNFSIEEAVMHYQTLILKCTETDQDTEYPSESDASAANACVHLLKAFVTVGYNLKSLLNPATNNPDSLDVRLSWLLMQNLKMFGQAAPIETVESITLAFATQLESLGMFEYSVYVLKTLPETEARNAIIARLVERNLTMKEDQLDKMEFLESLSFSR